MTTTVIPGQASGLTNFFDQLGISLGARPIYVQSGQDWLNIGYITDNSVPCNANIYMYPQYVDEANHGFYPPSLWWTKDDFAIMVPLSKWCLDQGKVPNWTAPVNGTVTVPNSNGATTTYAVSPTGQVKAPPGANLNPSNLLDDVTSAVQPFIDNVTGAAGGALSGVAMPALLIGGAVFGLLLLTRGRR